MSRAIVLSITAILTVLALGCTFSEFTQEKKIEENIDDYRTGCEVDAETLMTEYKLWEANRLAFLGRPTPTPRPVTDTEVALQVFLERVWEHGCATGRRDVTGAKQTTLLELRDQLNLIDERLTKLEEAEKTTPTATPTP